MHYTAVLVALAATALQVRAQDCFGTGPEFQGPTAAPIQEACANSLSGSYPTPNFEKTDCVAYDNFNKIDFLIRFQGGNDNQNLFESDCVNILGQIAATCPQGGTWFPTDFGQFFFSIDPNEGQC